jgi:hypothetical protein
MAISGYDQWKTAAPDDDYYEVIEFTEELQNTGRIDHGLCGKDADLDPGGQINIIDAMLILDHEPVYALVKMNVYANICCPDEEKRAEIAGEIVCDETRYPGEWTGSDYWTFKISDDRYWEIKIDCPHIDSLETDHTTLDKVALANFCNDEIFKNQEIVKFQKAMADLSKMIDDIE